MLRDLLFRLKHGTEELNYGREIVAGWAACCLEGVKKPRVLDLGVGQGFDLLNIRAALGRPAGLHGVECYEPYAEQAEANGICVARVDLERQALPYEAASMDLVVANQVLEHVKELFWIVSEVHRVLKPGGHFVVGVPNLASLHNRLALLAGMQPTSINLLSAHVRGFTKPAFTQFATEGGYFASREFAGANFYPFPPSVARPLAKALPSMAVSCFFLLRKTEKPGTFLDVLRDRMLETPFYAG